jgi:membrane-bound metal-dependent hydrolase YbcI (DUF457 family)
MMKSDDLEAGQPSYGTILLKRALIGIFGGLTLVVLAGVLAGYLSVAVERAHLSVKGGVVLALIVGLITLVGFGMWRFWPRTEPEPVAPRVRSARNLVALTGVLGIPLGVMLGIADDGTGLLFSNGPISPVIAATAIFTWAIAVPLLTWLWWRKIDEHEADAYRDGALVAAHGYLFTVPTWWMATRAGWLPPQDPMLVLLVVACLWCAVWFARRYL